MIGIFSFFYRSYHYIVVMSRVEEGHGKFIGMSAMPSSQSVYGVVLMKGKIADGALAPMNAIGIGASVGVALLFSAASGMQAAAKQPAIFGKCFAALGIVESFALFAFVFGTLLM